MFDLSALKAVIGFSDVISNVISRRSIGGDNGGGAVLELPTPRPVDTTSNDIEELLDLRLPADQMKAFKPGFDALLLRWEDTTVPVDLFENEQRHLHRFGTQSQPKLHFCMHLPKRLVDSYRQKDRVQVDFIRRSFKSGDRVYLVSKEVHFLNVMFAELFKDWRLNGIELRFVPWGKVEEISQFVAKAGSFTDEVRTAFLSDVFDLARPAFSEENILSRDDRAKLTRILVGAAEVNSIGAKEYFAQLLKSSELPQNWKNERLEAFKGNPTTDAPDLISWAESKRRNDKPGRQYYTALAELILVLLPSLGVDDANFLRDLVRKVPLAYSEALAAF